VNNEYSVIKKSLFIASLSTGFPADATYLRDTAVLRENIKGTRKLFQASLWYINAEVDYKYN
jgi:hypothetical protein